MKYTMQLTSDGQKSFDFSVIAYLKGMCTPEELKNALDDIFTGDLEKQSDFLVDKGFSAVGAFNHIYNCDTQESEVL